MPDPTDRCLNCGGTEQAIGGSKNPGRDGTRYYVCADCSHPWGEPPTRPCPSACWACGKHHEKCLCGGSGRIDVSDQPLCSGCRRRYLPGEHVGGCE